MTYHHYNTISHIVGLHRNTYVLVNEIDTKNEAIIVIPRFPYDLTIEGEIDTRTLEEPQSIQTEMRKYFSLRPYHALNQRY